MAEVNNSKLKDKHAVVAKVLDSYNVVINKGSTNGIMEGDRFLIYELTEDIKDPISGESLGPLELTKGTGKVIDVYEKKAVVQSDKQRTDPQSYTMRMLINLKPEDLLIPFKDPKEKDIAKRI